MEVCSLAPLASKMQFWTKILSNIPYFRRFARAAPPPLAALASRISFACGAKNGSELAQSCICHGRRYLCINLTYCLPNEYFHIYMWGSPYVHLFLLLTLPRSIFCSYTFSLIRQFAKLDCRTRLVFFTAHCQGCRESCRPLLGKCFAPIPTCSLASMGVLRFLKENSEINKFA